MSKAPEHAVEDEMRPEYDFSNAVRGVTAPRYAERATIEILPPAQDSARSAHSSDLPNPRQRLQELGCIQPQGLALLPANLDTADSIGHLVQAPEAATVAKLVTQAGLPPSDLWTKEDRPPYIQHNAFEWVGPALFIPAALLAQNPACVSIAVGVIANYVTDFLRGVAGDKKVTLDIVVEPTEAGPCKRVRYEGPPEQLTVMSEIVASVLREE